MQAIGALGLTANDIDDVIITHSLRPRRNAGSFPRATFHLQPAEMAYATGPCMCEDVFANPSRAIISARR